MDLGDCAGFEALRRVSEVDIIYANFGFGKQRNSKNLVMWEAEGIAEADVIRACYFDQNSWSEEIFKCRRSGWVTLTTWILMNRGEVWKCRRPVPGNLNSCRPNQE